MVSVITKRLTDWSRPPTNWITRDLPGAFVRLDGRWMRDAQGRALLLRGFNLSARSKLPPHYPLPDEAHLDRLASWGMNCLRLVLVWEAVEPRRGQYNTAYLDAMVDLARAAWQRGMYTIIDMHQDLFSRGLGGSGAPVWSHLPVRTMREPGRYWFSGYLFDADITHAFTRFWTNADFIRDSFVHAWGEVARHFADVEGVLGYDLFNEPATRFFPEMLSGHFDHQTLPLFYRQVAEMIRTIDTRRLIFIEPGPLAALGIPSLQGRRIDPEPLRDVPGLVYAPHLYEGLTFLLGRFYGDSTVLRHTLHLHMLTAAQLQAGVIIGEFGVLNDIHGAHDLYAAKLDLFDRYMLNWIAWNYMVGDHNWNDEDISVVFPDGQERSQVDVLVRPYPQATAGTPLGVSFDRQSNTFVFTFLPSAQGDAASEVFLPHRHYPHGFDLRLSQGLRADYDAERQLLLVHHTPGTPIGGLAVYARAS